MNNSKQIIIVVVVAIIGLGGGFFLNQYLAKDKSANAMPHAERKVDISTPEFRPEFALKDLEGTTRYAKEWDGKVLLINFWATWCPPCVREIPAFVDLHEAYKDKGFEIVGIAIDNKQAVIDFIDPMGADYPILLGEEAGIKLSQAYGNRLGVLPYSIIVDRKGKIVSTHRSEMTYDAVEKAIKPLL
ncbi:MAG: TlpA disulfide reductase family protein [Gammaproteobacteria bacterium]|jgi:thiol-disulfide isomerase/thioredoxin